MTTTNDEPSSKMPDEYDRLLGLLHGLNDVVNTREALIRVIPPFGVGGTQTFLVQTYRRKEEGDTIFLTCVTGDKAVRLVLPAKVSDVIARQRDQLSGKSRSKAAKAVAEDRKERGILPGFMQNPKKKAKTKAKA